ncbi:MAG: hypothetical protein F6K24_53610 [Okeania sp. SIO2D1]|nr:hypothetical protein [Okeania sp. SIO2D1]
MLSQQSDRCVWRLLSFYLLLSNSYCSLSKAIAVFGDYCSSIYYCPIVIALSAKRSLCLAIIELLFTIVQ